MAHVEIRNHPDNPGGFQIVVDGHDLSFQVLSEGFRVEFPNEVGDRARVHMVVAADTIDADLPDAVIEAARQQPDESRQVGS